MSYDLRFEGTLAVSPRLTVEQQAILNTFARTGRALAAVTIGDQPPVAVLPGGAVWVRRGDSSNHSDSAESTDAPEDSPRGSCCWRTSVDGATLEWDGDENFGGYAEWLIYLISRFLRPWGCRLDGRVRWEGEDGATGTLVVADNEVRDEPDESEPSVDEEVRALMNTLRGEDGASRLMAARELSCAATASPSAQPEAIDALVAALRNPELVKAALESLGAIGEPASSAVESVTRLLQDPDHQVRYWATFALARFGRRAATAIPALRTLVNDAEYGPRYGAIDALKRLGNGT